MGETMETDILSPEMHISNVQKNKKKERDLNLTILNNSRIIERNNFKFLGIIFDLKLTWDNHHIKYINASTEKTGSKPSAFTHGKTPL